MQALTGEELAADEQVQKQIDCLWVCDKQRNGGWEGKIGLWFDPKSLQYLSFHNQKPFRYVDYSSLEKKDV